MLTVIRSKFFTHLPILRYSCNSRHPRGTDWSPISWQSSLLLPAFFSSAFPAFWAPRAFSVFCLPKNYVPKLGMPPPTLCIHFISLFLLLHGLDLFLCYLVTTCFISTCNYILYSTCFLKIHWCHDVCTTSTTTCICERRHRFVWHSL